MYLVSSVHTTWKSGKKISAKIVEDIFRPTAQNVSLCDINYGIEMKVVNTSQNLIVKSTMFPYYNIHKFAWMSPDQKTVRSTIFPQHNIHKLTSPDQKTHIDCSLIDSILHASILDVLFFKGADCDPNHEYDGHSMRCRTSVGQN
jgi:hypothetical protein